MNGEVLENTNPAEVELRRILERYQDSPLSTWETFEYYGVGDNKAAKENREQNKTAFMSGEIRNPVLAYPLLTNGSSAREFANLEHMSLDLMKDVASLDYDADRETAAYDILRTRYLEIAMLQISQRFAAGRGVDEEKESLVELFNLANDEVHGRLSPARYNGLFEIVLQQSLDVLLDDDIAHEVKSAAEYIVNNAKLAVSQSGESYTPDTGIIETLSELVSEHDADLLELVPQKAQGEVLDFDELVSMFKAAHEARKTGWRVVVDEGTAIRTNQSDKTTKIGNARKPVDSTEAAKLLIHENGVHVQRRVEGDRLNDPLLGGTGLEGYLAPEEGLTTILEQTIDGKPRVEAGVQYYLMLAWARGLDGQPRDFRDVYELEWRRRVVKDGANAKDEELQSIVEKSKKQAWITSVRIFRGTPCDIPGMVYTKDQAYFVGNQNMWEYMDEMVKLPEEQLRQAFDRLYKAKFNPNDPLHNRIVDATIERAEIS